MVELVNDLRSDLGLGSLAYSSALSDVARGWSETMREDGIFKHNPRYAEQYPAGWRSAGENIARIESSGSLLEQVLATFRGLENSPGHYAAMTNPDFNQIGVGVAVSGRKFWVTQNFAQYP